MKTAKAKIFTFDLECPECNGLLENPNDRSLSWNIHEIIPDNGICVDCGVISKTPNKVSGLSLSKEKPEKKKK